MKRRQFLKILGSLSRQAVAEAPKQIAKIPKQTVGNIRQLDSISKSIKKQGPRIIGRRSVLRKVERRVGKALISNPKEAAAKVSRGLGVVKESILRAANPSRLIEQQAEGRVQLGRVGRVARSLLGRIGFSRYPLRNSRRYAPARLHHF